MNCCKFGRCSSSSPTPSSTSSFLRGGAPALEPKAPERTAVVGAAFAIWVFIKVPQEYWIHIAQLDITDTIKQGLFGVPTDTSWEEIVRDNIPFFIGLIAVIALLIAGLYWFVTAGSRRLTGVSRSMSMPTVRMSLPRRSCGPASGRAGSGTPSSLKIVLVSLVTIIFSRILPNVQASVTTVAIGVAVVIVANTVISELLVRRGVRWGATALEFIVMAAVNALIVAAFFAVLPFTGGSIDTPATLFAVLLLTLLVTLYDRFRPYYVARRSGAELRVGE